MHMMEPLLSVESAHYPALNEIGRRGIPPGTKRRLGARS